MTAKDIMLRPITAAEARKVVEREHYSGKVVQNSQMHIGVFYAGKLEGAMQFGPSLDKRKVAGLVRDTGWHEFTELNRMAFSERLPRNSESRALGVAMRLLKKHAPQVKWVVSFADGAQCGDGTIYRASGFLLTGIKENDGLFDVPGYGIVQRMTLEPARPTPIQVAMRKALGEQTCSAAALVAKAGGRPVPGYQFRYIRFLDPTWLDRLTVPVIPFADIPPQARMYRGQRGAPGGPSGNHPEEGGSTPTAPLHSSPPVAPPPLPR